MRQGFDESPLNPVPAAVWALVLPIIASEIAFGLSIAGFFGGNTMRPLAIEQSAFSADILRELVRRGDWLSRHMLRIVTYPFIHYSLTHAAFVAVFALALGKQLSEVLRPIGVIVLFFGCAVAAALAYTLIGGLTGMRLSPLVGGYPAVYGFVGAFTFLLWARLGQTGGNRLRAFTLIGFLLGFQLIFGLIFGNTGTAWIAEVSGFVAGFVMAPLLVPGGLARVRQAMRGR